MIKLMVSVVPEEPENGKGSIVLYEINHKGEPTNEIMKKSFSIGVQTDGPSLVKEGKYWFKKNKSLIIQELKEEGYEEINFLYLQMGCVDYETLPKM